MPRLSVFALTCVASLLLAGCARQAQGDTAFAAQTSAGRGEQLIERTGCGACHTIPGIPQADGMVGPPLEHIASRQYLAGMLRNTPDNMVIWLRFPQRIVPGNAMPDLGLSETDARAMSAYLEGLK